MKRWFIEIKDGKLSRWRYGHHAYRDDLPPINIQCFLGYDPITGKCKNIDFNNLPPEVKNVTQRGGRKVITAVLDELDDGQYWWLIKPYDISVIHIVRGPMDAKFESRHDVVWGPYWSKDAALSIKEELS